MIGIKEILKDRAKFEDLDKETQANLTQLLDKINKVRAAYARPMKVNDGYRRPQDTPPNGAIKSKHLTGSAVDIDDDEAGTLWKWCMQNLQLLKDVGLWLEHGGYTHNKKYGTWVHFQIVAPNSGHRIFLPSSEPNPNPSFWDGKYDPKLD